MPGEDLTSYVQGLAKRAEQMERDLFKLAGEEHEQSTSTARMHSTLSQQILTLKHEMELLNKQLMHHVHETTKLLHAYKDTVQHQEFNRIDQRVNAWKGERLITRTEFLRMIRREAPLQAPQSQPRAASGRAPSS